MPLTPTGGNADPDDYEDGRALAARVSRTDGSGLVSSSQRYNRPWQSSNGREFVSPPRDPEAARPLKTILEVAAQGHMPTRADLDALAFSDDLTAYKRRQVVAEIAAEAAQIVATFRSGEQLDARVAARAATSRLSEHLVAVSSDPADAISDDDARGLAALLPRRT